MDNTATWENYTPEEIKQMTIEWMKTPDYRRAIKEAIYEANQIMSESKAARIHSSDFIGGNMP